MADINSKRECDWGPWQSQMPPIGHPFILHLEPERQEPKVDFEYSGSNGGRYKITKTTKSSSNTILDMDKWIHGRWDSGHQWEMSAKPRFRMLIQNAIATAVVDKYAGQGCVCTKCNDRNRWAEPNQPNGTYICFACPNPNKRR